jgi:hypothetical protein
MNEEVNNNDAIAAALAALERAAYEVRRATLLLECHQKVEEIVRRENQ